MASGAGAALRPLAPLRTVVAPGIIGLPFMVKAISFRLAFLITETGIGVLKSTLGVMKGCMDCAAAGGATIEMLPGVWRTRRPRVLVVLAVEVSTDSSIW